MSYARFDLFGDVGSDITSATYLVADAAEMTLDLDVDSATTVVVQGSNQQGFRTDFVEGDWSTLTTIVSISANEMLNIEPGFRWLRVLRETASTASLAKATVGVRNVVWGRG